jgi:cytochrome c-type biogenesis protein CcmE
LTFETARAAKSTVQIMGKLDKSSITSDAHALNFTLISKEGDRMPVSFTATRPANFSQATEITAQGTFDGQVFRASNLLVKCPSKYQGKETEKSYTAGKS